MPNTSSSVPFLLSSSMQSIRSRRTSACMGMGSPFGSGSGLLQQLGSGMVRQITSVSGTTTPMHHLGIMGIRTNPNNPHNNSNYVRKCPSLNITFSH